MSLIAPRPAARKRRLRGEARVGTWTSFTTGGFAGPVCLAITVVLLIFSAIAWRKKGLRSGIRGAAWSLLPLAAYLTHALGLLGRVVSAIVQFAGGFVFSPKAWLGIILVGVSAVLFLISGGIPLFSWNRRRKKAKQNGGRGGRGGDGGGHPQASLPPARRQEAAPSGGDDSMREVEEILRKRGIS
jgi:hypothetical protein